MARVDIKPMPRSYLAIPKRLRPGHPPIYDDSVKPVTDEDRALAAELVAALDPESRAWYGAE